MLDLIIRKIAKNEIEFLSEMLYEALFVEEGMPKLPRAIIKEHHLAKYIENFGENEFDQCFVALENGTLIGACWGRIFSEENKGYGYVDHETPELSIALKETFRNKGVGSRLILQLVHQYQKMGVEAISLSVDKKNDAIRLYQKIGFKTIEETQKSATMLKAI